MLEKTKKWYESAIKPYRLIDFENDINATDELGMTILMWACAHARDDVVSELIKVKGIDVIKRDNNGLNALIHACRARFEENYLIAPENLNCIKLLLESEDIVDGENFVRLKRVGY